jgi:cell fate regulator YaaT (PSP1 superfamily)
MGMPLIVGVRFKPVTKIYYFDPNSIAPLEANTRVIVETSRGIEMGTVAQAITNVPHDDIKGKLKRVIRRATPVDLMQVERYKAQEAGALEKCDELVRKLDIPVRVIDADYSFDGSRLVFSFVSEQRVDFRDLVKELSSALSTRIEMKQVGARDETKILDGYGRCGRRLCCSSWLTEFHPVSIKMAKNQGLPLAPAEISGLCGRLLCCLAYENELYVELRKMMPKVGAQVKIDKGVVGTVIGLNILKEMVLINTEQDNNYVEVPVQEIEILRAGKAPPPKPLKKDEPAEADEEA